MKIEKLLLYYDAFPVHLLTDTRPESDLKTYDTYFGEPLTESLSNDGQREPVIINVWQNEQNSHIRVEPGGERLYAMRELKWQFCRAVLITYNFMIPYLKKVNFLNYNHQIKTLKQARVYFFNVSDHSYVWVKNFMNH